MEHKSLDKLLAEEEQDPAMYIYDLDDKDEQQRSDEAGGAASAEEAAVHIIDDEQ